jgi:hypothetical protein
MNIEAIKARSTELRANDFVVYATSVIYAQGVTLTAEQRAHLTARGDHLRNILGETAKQRIIVNVHDPRHPEMKVGELMYMV